MLTSIYHLSTITHTSVTRKSGSLFPNNITIFQVPIKETIRNLSDLDLPTFNLGQASTARYP